MSNELINYKLKLIATAMTSLNSLFAELQSDLSSEAPTVDRVTSPTHKKGPAPGYKWTDEQKANFKAKLAEKKANQFKAEKKEAKANSEKVLARITKAPSKKTAATLKQVANRAAATH